MPKRTQTQREEMANAITHGFGAVLVAVASPFLVTMSLRNGDVWAVVSTSIFAATAVFLYLASMIYHALSPGRLKQIFKVIDHSAIFLLIAGTYTPFTLGVLRGPWGWSLFGVIWGLALLGLVAECAGLKQLQSFSVVLYLAMGWLAVVAIVPMVTHMQFIGIILVFAGGVAYTTGVIFFAIQQIRYFHTVWHFFVMLGTTFHFFAVINYAV